MATITEDYISFEIAKLLKDKGFEERIRSWYDNNRLFHEEGCRMSNSDCLPPTVMAPTLQMTMKWLREVHNLQIIIIPIRTKQHKNWTFEIYKEFNSLTIDVFCFSTYEEACEAAIKYCLENLI